MYKWKIEIILKSGKELTVYHGSDKNNSRDVANSILAGDCNAMNGFSDKNGTKNIFVKLGEIAAASISIA